MSKIDDSSLTLLRSRLAYGYVHCDMIDLITCLNLVFSGKEFLVSRSWYRKCVAAGLLDYCCFDLNVLPFAYSPNTPVLNESPFNKIFQKL